jgi:hypothetical protein
MKKSTILLMMAREIQLFISVTDILEMTYLGNLSLFVFFGTLIGGVYLAIKSWNEK